MAVALRGDLRLQCLPTQGLQVWRSALGMAEDHNS
jgi:hypothetical protein